MKALLLTLGHNSSAILVEDGEIKWGYETERVTGVKSDSQFPRPVLDKYLMSKPDVAYVTHWAPDGMLSSMSKKHWNPAYLEDVPIRTLSAMCSHHDTHMSAARCYAGKRFPYGERTIGLVVDGFGTFGEHFSVYELTATGQRLIERVHGYGTSLGLWYQYATAFMGMKMHEDEYKLLGYEVHVPPHLVNDLSAMANETAHDWIIDMGKSVYGSKYDPLYDLNALDAVKHKIFEHLGKVCRRFDVEDPHSERGRAILAYYVQYVLEGVVLRKILQYGPKHVILSGGCFYNVKLNHRILDTIDGQLCVYPLCGDQGNAIGLYYMDHPEFKFPRDLNWGHRRLEDQGHVPGLCVVDEVDGLTVVQHRLKSHGYVNVVRGSMEFGPRALCHTSTLALPTPLNVAIINAANDRNTVMPMAPVMDMGMYKRLYEKWDHVWRSHRHMVIAMEHVEAPWPDMAGVTHEYNVPYHHHTGRPQVIDDWDSFMKQLLAGYQVPLINTSFNYHGMPIALGMESIIKNHMMQYQRQRNFATVVIRNDK